MPEHSQTTAADPSEPPAGRRAARRAPLSISNRWRPFADIPSPVRAETWTTFTWDNKGTPQHGIWLRSSEAPWGALFAALDELGQGLPSEPVSIDDEADAIVACCWRYGSYFDLLTGGELFPPFRVDPDLSRLGDYETKRINLEYSSGVAAWLCDRDRDPARVWRRVRGALAHLPMPWRKGRDAWWMESVRYSVQRRAERLAEILEGFEQSAVDSLAAANAKALSVPEEQWLRQEANYAVNSTYRNGPIEDFHAGWWSHGGEIPGFLRFYPGEVTKLADDAAAKMAMHLLEGQQTAPELLRLVHAIGSPDDWSLTEETANVRFDGMPGTGSLAERVQHLAERYPARYGAGIEPK